MFAYVGGKYRQAKWINEFIPKDVKYYSEVFGGAFWTYVRSDKNFDKVYYNDINRYLSNVFECCRYPEEFLKYLESTPAQDFDTFNVFKSEVLNFENQKFEIPNFKLAHMYMYIVTQTFSGIMSKNVKMVDLKGKYKSKYYSFTNRVKNKKIQERLRNIEVSNMSYDQFIKDHDNKDMLFYLDPPYYKTEKLYAFHDFGLEDHEKLSKLLNNTKSRWILSYYEYPQLNDWYPKDNFLWEKKEYKKSSMASKDKKQTTAEELLIIKGD